MMIDFRQDAEEIRALLKQGVDRYLAKNRHPKASAFHPPVTAIGLWYDAGYDARVSLNFDSRPDYEAGETWTHGSFAELARPQWTQAYEALAERDLHLTLLDGSAYTLKAGTNDEPYVALFGEMLVALLKSARDSAVFAPLPKSARCELSVEDVEGFIGWPSYEHRGKDNLV